MKKILIMLAIFSGSVASPQLYAQDTPETTKDNDGPNFSKLDVSPLDVALFRNPANEPVARVLYSRPQTRDREIFGKLVPYGEVWRTGANEATEITLFTDMTVGGKTIKKGTYTLLPFHRKMNGQSSLTIALTYGVLMIIMWKRMWQELQCL